MLVDLAGGIGDVAGRAQVVLVVEILVDLGLVEAAGPIALPRGEGLELGGDAGRAGEYMLRVFAQRRDVPRVDIERLAAGTPLDDAVGIGVVLEGDGLPRVAGDRLEPIALALHITPVRLTTGRVPRAHPCGATASAQSTSAGAILG